MKPRGQRGTFLAELAALAGLLCFLAILGVTYGQQVKKTQRWIASNILENTAAWAAAEFIQDGVLKKEVDCKTLDLTRLVALVKEALWEFAPEVSPGDSDVTANLNVAGVIGTIHFALVDGCVLEIRTGACNVQIPLDSAHPPQGGVRFSSS